MTRSFSNNAWSQPGIPETVLVVDDDPSVRTLVRRLLEAHGYEVVVARGGEEALEALERGDRPFDLLITDVFMPGMSGPELVQAAKKTDPKLEILFMSGRLAENLAELESVRKQDKSIAKPFTKDEILGQVRELLRDRPRAAAGSV